EIDLHHWGRVCVWGVVTLGISVLGQLTEMTALQRFEATRVAPPIYVVQTVIPVVLAPALAGERWGHTPGGGLLLIASLVLVSVGGAILGASRTVEHVRGHQPEDDLGGGG